MPPELTESPVIEAGQAAPTAPPVEGTSAAAPVETDGQAPVEEGTDPGQALSTQEPEPSFFDPTKVPEELQPAYKLMQAAFTRKTQALRQDRQKIEAYDAFMKDPVSQIQQLAQSYGMTLTKAQAKAELARQEESGGGEAWEPKSWDDVLTRATEMAESRILQQLAPVFKGVQQLQGQNIEAQLNKIDPNWKLYEDDMRANMVEHPTLIKDVAKLYRMSVPEEVYTSKAVQTALKRLEGKTQAATVGSKSQTSRTQPAPMQVSSFADAIEEAKRQLAERR